MPKIGTGNVGNNVNRNSTINENQRPSMINKGKPKIQTYN